MTIFTFIFEKLTELIFLFLIMEEFVESPQYGKKYFTYCSWIGKICIFVTMINSQDKILQKQGV